MDGTVDAECGIDVVYRVYCGGQRFELLPAQCPGFLDRVAESLFSTFSPASPTAGMISRQRDGTIIIEGVDSHDFAKVWEFLRTGLRPRTTCIADFMKWRHLADLFCIHGALLPWSSSSVILTSSGCLAHPNLDPGKLYIFDDSPISIVERKSHEFLDLCNDVSYSAGLAGVSGRSRSRPSTILGSLAEVKLCPEHGMLLMMRFGLASSCGWQFCGAHPQLKGKALVAALVRQWIGEGDKANETGLLMFLHIAPLRHAAASKQTPEMALAPSFWIIVRLRDGLEASLELMHMRLCSGCLAMMRSGTVFVMENPHSIRKARLLFFTSAKCNSSWSSGVSATTSNMSPLLAPGFFAVASPPQPYNPWRSAGKGTGKSKGYNKGNGHLRPKGLVCQKRSVLTVHPAGRALQALWLVESKESLVLVLHAVDGRVCVGQVQGEHGIIPPQLSCANAESPRHWNIWSRRLRSGSFSRPGSFSWKYINHKRRYDVPICDEIVAVLPQTQSILILHRNHSRPNHKVSEVLVWKIDVPTPILTQDGSVMERNWTFFGCTTAGIDGKGMKGSTDGWAATHWVQNQTLPANIVDHRWPALLLVDDLNAPEERCDVNNLTEVLKYNLADASAAPIVHSWPPAFGAKGKGKDGKGRPPHSRLTVGPAGRDINQDGSFELSNFLPTGTPTATHFVAFDLRLHSSPCCTLHAAAGDNTAE